MKIYTKILIGMAVGAIIGLTLGPKSGFLEHDSYEIEKASGVTLLADKDNPESKLNLPASSPLNLRVQETAYAEVTDGNGKVHRLPAFVRVQFKFSKKMSLADKDGSLSKALGDAKVGSKVEAWLVMEHRPLDSGDILVFPIPVSQLGTTIITWISPVGDLFMRLIKMVIVPLVFASLLVGVAGLGDVRKLGRLGSRTLGLYLMTTAGAVTIGLMLAHIIQPGNFVAEKDRAALVASFESAAESKMDAAAEAPSFVENVLSIIPSNPMESLASGDMLQIIFFAFIFGIALTMLEAKRATQVITLLDTVQHAMILIIHMVMAVAPFGVAALIAKVVGQSGVSILSALAVYAITVIIGLGLLATLIYGGLVRFVAKLPFVQFLKAARPAQLIAFSTSSSSATLPITLECAEENLGISKSVSSFVIPLGSTVNMDGTALYQGVAAIFIAQVFEVDLSFGAELGIVFAATAASIGAAGVPGAGMITLAMVLTSAGIPAVGVALILGVDRLLDMFRTAVNVTGDLAVTAVMAVSEGESLHTLSTDEDLQDKTRGFEGRTDRKHVPVEPEGDAERDE
jgi:Na+/H+-dicarboxylate symporter